MKSVAISQSNYIPWKGYFDLIARVDEFVLFDDMQYTRRDWRNRNKIKTPNGLQWVTIPVEVKGKYFQKINETRIADSWAMKHWNGIRSNYAKSPFFEEYSDWLATLYKRAESLELLSDVNYLFIEAICEKLGIKTKLSWSSEYELADDKTERLLSICEQAGGTRYVSGPAARDYLDESMFESRGVAVEWMDYSDYPEYPQLHGDFEHGVSVLDLMLQVGSDTPRFMKWHSK